MNSPSIKIFPGESSIARVRILPKEVASKDFNGKKLTFLPDGNKLRPEEEEYQKYVNRIGARLHKENPESSRDHCLWMNTFELRGSTNFSTISKQTLTKNLQDTAVSKKEAQDLYRAFGVATPISHLTFGQIMGWSDLTKLHPIIDKCHKLNTGKVTALAIREMAGQLRLSEAATKDSRGEPISVSKYVVQNGMFPDHILLANRTEFPLTGVPELLAVSKILGDPMCLFEIGIMQSANDQTKSQITKAGQNVPFQYPSLESNSGLSRFFGGNKALSKDISLKDGKKMITIKWGSLSQEQQKKFLTTLLTAGYLIKNGLLREHIFENSSGPLKYSGLDDYNNMVAHFSQLSQVYDLENVRKTENEIHCAALIDAGWLCHQIGDDAQALFFINDAIARLGNQKNQNLIFLRAQVIKGIILSRQGKYDEARKWLMPMIDFCGEGPNRIEIIKSKFGVPKTFPRLLVQRPFPEIIDGVYELGRCFELSAANEVSPEESKWIAYLLYLEYTKLHVNSSSDDALSESLVHAAFYQASYCNEQKAYDRQVAALGELFKKYDYDRLIEYPNVSNETKRKIIYLHYLLAEAYANLETKDPESNRKKNRKAFNKYKTFLMLHEQHFPPDQFRAEALHMMGETMFGNEKYKASVAFYRDAVRVLRKLMDEEIDSEKQAEYARRIKKFLSSMRCSYHMENVSPKGFDQMAYNPKSHLKYMKCQC